MAAYVITFLEVTDPEAFEAYRKVAGPTFAPFGGKPVVVDGRFEVLEGMVCPKSIVVIEFETLEQAKRWYASPEYARSIPMRQQSANTSLILVDGVPASSPVSPVR
ncbi:MAG TPA: DUF1330 domain-containing protein [Methylomirabilota bacterium]|jgi:uncharacterized protein (DUF1330 family)|nr:DUF1330 domain-containing protein [Methylomirabilota bacterium]